MSEPFLAEIKMFGFNFPPRGWATCDGQILPINQNQSLYSLLGTTYGGDGLTTFALPDLRGRVPLHVDAPDHNQGSKGGTETHTLTTQETPVHTHALNATSNDGDNPIPTGILLGSFNNSYADGSVPPADIVNLTPTTVSSTGGGAHQNIQPSLVIEFCIALQGLFPPRN
jgi:microcystin-dependent protein